MKMTFWGDEFDMAEAIFRAIKASNRSEFETAISMSPMSFNIFYAGRDGEIGYWHTGRYQDRSDGVDPRLPHRGDGSEEWGGFIPFASLPADANPAQGFYVNWNNKPVSWWDNGDNVPWIGWHPVLRIDDYVRPIVGFSFDDLKDVPRQIGDHGTYQQAVEIQGGRMIDENVLPPGQSGFISLSGQPSPHNSDQWPLHLSWEYKDMKFGEYPRRQYPVSF
jgi:acyl-homoserine lactone acylase PvdQ